MSKKSATKSAAPEAGQQPSQAQQQHRPGQQQVAARPRQPEAEEHKEAELASLRPEARLASSALEQRDQQHCDQQPGQRRRQVSPAVQRQQQQQQQQVVANSSSNQHSPKRQRCPQTKRFRPANQDAINGRTSEPGADESQDETTARQLAPPAANSAQGTAGNSQHVARPAERHMAGENICAACLRPIRERYLLVALDKQWHEDCLKCACCDCRLGEVGSSLFTHADKLLCRRDFLRIFGQPGHCAACKRPIPPYELVMRAQGNAYHMDCFACQQCQYRFCVGDRFHLTEEHRIVCLLCHSDQEAAAVAAAQQQPQPQQQAVPGLCGQSLEKGAGPEEESRAGPEEAGANAYLGVRRPARGQVSGGGEPHGQQPQTARARVAQQQQACDAR